MPGAYAGTPSNYDAKLFPPKTPDKTCILAIFKGFAGLRLSGLILCTRCRMGHSPCLEENLRKPLALRTAPCRNRTYNPVIKSVRVPTISVIHYEPS